MSTIPSRTTPARTFVFEETRVTRYVALDETAAGFTIPDPAQPLSDRHFHPIEFPGVIEVAAVIMFRTRHSGGARFTVRINQERLTQYAFRNDDPPERCWHEIIPARGPAGPTLRAHNNELTFGVSEGTVTFGDVVILYTSNEATVKISVNLPVTLQT